MMCYIAIQGFNTPLILQNVLQSDSYSSPSWHIHWARETSQRLNGEPLPVTHNKKKKSGICLSPIFYYLMLLSQSQILCLTLWYLPKSHSGVTTCIMSVFNLKRDKREECG